MKHTSPSEIKSIITAAAAGTLLLVLFIYFKKTGYANTVIV